jgi:AraC-like DNA-binding protein
MLQDLSRDTGIPQHHLQLLIHKVEEKKFSEFINEYRIQHLQDQIERGGMKNKTLEGLAAESGFSSKATFIRSVKKHTGRTPKEYFNRGKAS